jgi:hypothetical protein
MSALPPKADMDPQGCDVRFVPKADIHLGGFQIDGEPVLRGSRYDRHTEAKRAGFGGRFCYRRQAGVLAGPAMARINRATCSGSSSWTKCRAPGIRNNSEPGRNS